MDISATLAADQTSYFIIGRQEKLYFGAKSTVQCSDQLKPQDSFKIWQKGALPTKVWSLRLRNYSSTGRHTFLLLLPTKEGPTDVQSDRRINWLSGFLSKIFDMSNIVGRPMRGLFGRPHKSF